MESNGAEPLEKDTDKDLAGKPDEIYSMTGNAPRDTDSDDGEYEIEKRESKAQKDPGDHPKKKSEPDPAEKKKKEIVMWRVGVSVLVILLIVGIGTFIVKGINWGLSKVSGQSATANYIPTLRSVADPGSSEQTGPVVSNMNVIPASAAAPDPSLANVNNPSAQFSNNCPDYAAAEYYYCEWLDSTNFRGYRTKEEYEQAKRAKVTTTSVPRSPVPASTVPAPSVYTPQTYQQPSAAINSSGIAANGCPSYVANEYSYCVWYSKTIFRGFRPGEYQTGNYFSSY